MSLGLPEGLVLTRGVTSRQAVPNAGRQRLFIGGLALTTVNLFCPVMSEFTLVARTTFMLTVMQSGNAIRDIGSNLRGGLLTRTRGGFWNFGRTKQRKALVPPTCSDPSSSEVKAVSKNAVVAISVLAAVAILVWLWFWMAQRRQGETTYQAQPPSGVGVATPQKQKMMGATSLQ